MYFAKMPFTPLRNNRGQSMLALALGITAAVVMGGMTALMMSEHSYKNTINALKLAKADQAAKATLVYTSKLMDSNYLVNDKSTGKWNLGVDKQLDSSVANYNGGILSYNFCDLNAALSTDGTPPDISGCTKYNANLNFDVLTGTQQKVAVSTEYKGAKRNITAYLAYSNNPAPEITSVTPNTGSVAGGDTVIIGGNNFLAGITIDIGGVPCIATSVTATKVTCTTSAHIASIVDVNISNPDGKSTSMPNAFTYIDNSDKPCVVVADCGGIEICPGNAALEAPISIKSLADFKAITAKHAYILDADIDFAGTPGGIGPATNYTPTIFGIILDGNGHSIKNVNGGKAIFDGISDSVIKNLSLGNLTVSSAGLVGYSLGSICLDKVSGDGINVNPIQGGVYPMANGGLVSEVNINKSTGQAKFFNINLNNLLWGPGKILSISGSTGTYRNGGVVGYVSRPQTSVKATFKNIKVTNSTLKGLGVIGGVAGDVNCESNFETIQINNIAIKASDNFLNAAAAAGGVVGLAGRQIDFKDITVSNSDITQGGVIGSVLADINITNAKMSKNIFPGLPGVLGPTSGSLGGAIGKVITSSVTLDKVDVDDLTVRTGGGLIGGLYSSTAKISNSSVSGTLTQSYKKTDVTTEMAGIGGFIGEMGGYEAGRSYVTANGAASADISNSYFVGTISAQQHVAGGFIGYAPSVSKLVINNSYFKGNISLYSTGSAAGMVGSLVIPGGLPGASFNKTFVEANITCLGTANPSCKYLGGYFGFIEGGTSLSPISINDGYYNGVISGLAEQSAGLFVYTDGSAVNVSRFSVSGKINGLQAAGFYNNGNNLQITDGFVDAAVSTPTGAGSGLGNRAQSGSTMALNRIYVNGPVGGTSGLGLNLGGCTWSLSSIFWDPSVTLATRACSNSYQNPKGANPLTTAQLHDQSNFPGWDFVNTWLPPTPTSPPKLRLDWLSQLPKP